MASNSKNGQAAVEYALILALTLLLVLVAFTLMVFWPSFAHSAEEQRAASAWASARPFSVAEYAMIPNMAVLEISNTEPVSLTITKIRLGGQDMDFSTHSVPVSWPGTPACMSGTCELKLRPGEFAIVSTANFTATNPCVEGGSFVPGRLYEIPLSIAYHGSNPSETLVQEDAQPLAGKCSGS